MGLMKELNDLNNIYHQMNKQEVSEDQDKGYVVTNADKKANTPAWQGYKKGVKSKTTGKPLYRAADHLKKEEVEVPETEYQPSETVKKLVESGKFTKEEILKIVEVESVDEGYQRNPEKGEEEERKAEKRRRENKQMPPRGDKRREDFERWYAANVR